MLKINPQRKLGAITIEVAIGIILAVIVLFVAIGLFNENLANMLTGSNIKNMFLNNNKTTYGSFNRDYADSQINVQIMGEQGLDMLRRIANNRAITQIDALYNGSDITVKNNSSIGYLVLAINAIVGSPDICVFMKKDSNKKCNEDGIGGYNYKVTKNGSGFIISKVGTGGESIPGTTPRYPYMSSGAAEALTVTITATAPKTSGGSSTPPSTPPAPTPLPAGTVVSPLSPGYNPGSVNPKDIYQYIVDISTKAKPFVYPEVLLVNVSTTTGGKKPLSPSIIAAFNGSGGLPSFKDPMQNAHDVCTGYFLGYDLDEPAYFYKNYPESQCGESGDGGSNHFVSNSEIKSVKKLITTLTNTISNAKGDSDSEIVNDILKSQEFSKFILLLEQDHINNSCGNFINMLDNIAKGNGLNINIPPCTPNP